MVATVIASALGTVGRNIVEQRKRQETLSDDLFRDLYSKVEAGAEALDTDILAAEQVIRDALAIGLKTQQQVESYLGSSPDKRAWMQQKYNENQSLFEGGDEDRLTPAQLFDFPVSPKDVTIGQDQIRLIAQRYTGMLVDPSVTSAQEQKTFGENFYDSLSINLGFQNPRQAALEQVKYLRGENATYISQVLSKSKRTPFEITGGMLPFKMPPDTVRILELKTAQLALAEAEDKRMLIEDSIYGKAFKKPNGEDDPSVTAINIFGVVVPRGTRLSELTGHLANVYSFSQAWENMTGKLPTSSNHAAFQRRILGNIAGSYDSDYKEDSGGIRFTNATTTRDSLAIAEATRNAWLFSQLRSGDDVAPTLQLLQSGYVPDQYVAVGLAHAFRGWAARKKGSSTNKTFAQFVSEFGDSAAMTGIFGKGEMPSAMLTRIQQWRNKQLISNYNQSLLPDYSDDIQTPDDLLGAINKKIQALNLDDKFGSIAASTNLNDAVLVLHQVHNEVYGTAPSEVALATTNFFEAFPVREDTSGIPSVTTATAPAPVDVDESDTIGGVNKEGVVTSFGERTLNLINQVTQLGLKSGEDPEGNKVDIENLDPEQRANLDRQWFAHAAALMMSSTKSGFTLKDVTDTTDTEVGTDTTDTEVGTDTTDTEVGTYDSTNYSNWTEDNVHGTEWQNVWRTFKGNPSDGDATENLVDQYKASRGGSSTLPAPRVFRKFLANEPIESEESLVDYVNRFLSGAFPEEDQTDAGDTGKVPTGLGTPSISEQYNLITEALRKLDTLDEAIAWRTENALPFLMNESAFKSALRDVGAEKGWSDEPEEEEEEETTETITHRRGARKKK